MPCPCTTNTLGLFTRNVAQVELPSSTMRANSRQWHKTAIRSFSIGATRARPSKSDSNVVLNRNIPFRRTPSSPRVSDAGSKSPSQRYAEAKNPAGGTERDAPAGKIKPTIRFLHKTKADSTGFKIHYSAPLVPAPPREPRSDTIRRLRSTGGKEEEWTPPLREHWQLDKAALRAKFPEGWKPLKRLSPDALAGIRALHAQDPAQYTTEVLASSFKISPEAIRRILKSKWSPDAVEETDRQRRWHNRGKSIYTRHAELGQKPPKKWRELGIGKGKPEWMLRGKREREGLPLPALITTSRARDAKYGPRARASEDLEDRMM